MDELVMKMKLMNRRRLSRHISSDSINFSSSVDDSDVSTTTSLLSDDENLWPPPLQTMSHRHVDDAEQSWWLRPVSRPPQTVGGVVSEVEMIKHRFSKLLLGEDMTGSGRGFSTAQSISNAIVNLSRSTFGKLSRLEPVPVEKKVIWKREMEWLLSVADHIVEMTPSYKTFPNGVTLEIMACNQRSDLSINLPALRKLDGMLLELLDGFIDTEFCKLVTIEADEKPLEKQNADQPLHVPQIPQNGFSTDSMTKLRRKRECAAQILKAAMLINTDAVSKMEVPKSYHESLPKTGKGCLGDQFYKFIASETFSVESVLHCLDLSAERIVAELANRLATAVYVWRRRIRFRAAAGSAIEAEKRELFSARAEDLLMALKQQFPQLCHTTLDDIKIQCNKDVGKSILESYSGVLKTLAYDIVARIDDLLSIEKEAHQRDNSTLSAGMMTLTQHAVSGVSSWRFRSNSFKSSNPDIVHFLDKVKVHNRPPKASLG